MHLFANPFSLYVYGNKILVKLNQLWFNRPIGVGMTDRSHSCAFQYYEFICHNLSSCRFLYMELYPCKSRIHCKIVRSNSKQSHNEYPFQQRYEFGNNPLNCEGTVLPTAGTKHRNWGTDLYLMTDFTCLWRAVLLLRQSVEMSYSLVILIIHFE